MSNLDYSDCPVIAELKRVRRSILRIAQNYHDNVERMPDNWRGRKGHLSNVARGLTDAVLCISQRIEVLERKREVAKQ